MWLQTGHTGNLERCILRYGSPDNKTLIKELGFVFILYISRLAKDIVSKLMGILNRMRHCDYGVGIKKTASY
jgi:hypothetical protein